MLDYVSKLIGLAALLQMCEYFLLRRQFSETGVWRWSLLKQEHGRTPALILSAFLDYPNVLGIFILGIFCSVGLFFNSIFAIPLLICLLLMSIRFRGSFNGGSDYMTILIVAALCFAQSSYSFAVKAALIYIAVQSALSYFISGVGKIRNSDWRNGTAIRQLLLHSHYPVPGLFRRFTEFPSSMVVISWSLLIFECLFPLAFLNINLCALFLGVGFIFHLLNSFVFGLNRFVFAWLASYPAILYCCWMLQHP